MKTLGKFEILDRIGQGAMGVVYKARDPRIGRLVALKTITTGLAEDPALLERFYHEAHSAGALQHPNIVTIYELGEEEHTPFIAMEYLTGQSLDKLIETRQKLPLSQKVGYIAYICRALAYAHKQAVVHRDIKPANVMVTGDGVVKVVDFGIARIAENNKSQSGLFIGTLGYMSPQQIEGNRADARSDIWAAGVLFYELLAYKRPFDGENYGALMLNIMKQPTPPLSETAPGTPPEVEAVIDRMLEKKIDERFQSMEETLIALEPVWRGLQRVEVADLLASTREMLEAGEVKKAFETARRVLQIDIANTQAKELLEQINAEMKKNPALAAATVEKAPKDDETYVGAAPAIPTALPGAAPPGAPAAQRDAGQTKPIAAPVEQIATSPARVPASVPTQVHPEPEAVATPASATAPAAVPVWKQPIAVVALVLVLAVGGGAYFFGLKKPDSPPAATPVAAASPISAVAAPPETPISAPLVVPSTAPGDSVSKQPTTFSTLAQVGGQAGTKPNQSNPATPKAPTLAPPTSGQQNSGTTATLTAATRIPEAPSSPAAPAPAAEHPEPAATPASTAPPVTVAAQPVAQPSQPVAAAAPAAAPTPAPAAPSKAAEAPVVSGAPADSLDRQAINLALQQLSEAFSHRSMTELTALWPTIDKDDRNSLKGAFDAAKSITRTFDLQSLSFTPDGNLATAIGSYSGAVQIGGKQTPTSGNFYVRFAKKNGRWYVDEARF